MDEKETAAAYVAELYAAVSNKATVEIYWNMAMAMQQYAIIVAQAGCIDEANEIMKLATSMFRTHNKTKFGEGAAPTNNVVFSMDSGKLSYARVWEEEAKQ